MSVQWSMRFTPVLWGLVLGGGLLFTLLCWQLNAPWLASSDHTLGVRLVAWRDGVWAQLFFAYAVGANYVGKGGPTVLASLLVAALLWWRRRRYDALLWPLAVCGAWALNAVLKYGIERMRPAEWQHAVFANGPSFPSGHATVASAVAVVLCYLLAHSVFLPARRGVAISMVLLLWGGCLLARPVLGVHYVSDVLAGAGVGVAWGALCLAWYRAQIERE